MKNILIFVPILAARQTRLTFVTEFCSCASVVALFDEKSHRVEHLCLFDSLHMPCIVGLSFKLVIALQTGVHRSAN